MDISVFKGKARKVFKKKFKKSGYPIATGIVNFLDDRGTLVGTKTLNSKGHATLEIGPGGAKMKKYIAYYVGDKLYKPDFTPNPPFSVTVIPAASVASMLSLSANKTTSSKPVTMKALVRGKTVKNIPTGIVHFWNGKKKILVDTSGNPVTAFIDSTGVATWRGKLKFGSYRVVAKFMGTSNFVASESVNRLPLDVVRISPIGG